MCVGTRLSQDSDPRNPLTRLTEITQTVDPYSSHRPDSNYVFGLKIHHRVAFLHSI
jgi:hypothetical protein